MNYKAIGKTIGVILSIEAGFMLPPLLLALKNGNTELSVGFAVAIAAALAVGLPLWLCLRGKQKLGARDAFAAAVLAWLALSAFGALPYYFGGILSAGDALFESVSGFTTSSATVIADVEVLPESILLWRSITNWLGGMGVLVFLLAITPSAKDGGSVYLLRAELPGPMSGKLVPRMQKNAKLLYEIYIIMTVLMTVLLCLDMPFFDAVNLSMSTVSTGGFSIKNDSLISYSTYAQGVTTAFMLLCGVSFGVFYCLAARDFLRIKGNRELRCYGIIFAAAVLLVGINARGSFDGVWDCIHHTLFEVSSIMSSTAHFSAYSGVWPPFTTSLLLVLMIIGPMSGSTGGGMKISRIMILMKSVKRTVGRIIVPDSVHVIHLNDETVDDETLGTVNAFVCVYLCVMLLTAVLLSFDGVSFGDGVAAAISSLSNVGATDMAGYSIFGKLILGFDMILGRLEIFPVLVLFSPRTWRK